ncbi:MAG: hypothetical protein KKH83_03485, partial [Candidatus Margulisbacteria bacterium]|nr:hypothetical protein [Candidatus Margulisiibacteriota bacterium]
PMVVTLIFALVLLVAGLLASKLLQKMVTLSLQFLQFDTVVKKLNFNKVLEKGDVKQTLSELFGDMVYWVSVFVVIVTVVSLFGIDIIPVLNKVFEYFGQVVVAAVVLGLGVVVAYLIARLIYAIGSNIGLGGSRTIAKIIQYAFIIFAGLVALAQLGIGSELIVPSIGVIIGSVGLALAIAFGLGCKDIIADFVSNLIRGK